MRKNKRKNKSKNKNKRKNRRKNRRKNEKVKESQKGLKGKATKRCKKDNLFIEVRTVQRCCKLP